MAAIHSDEFKRDAIRVALTSGLTRDQVASDLGIGLSTLGKWIRAVSEEAKVPAQDAELLREKREVLGSGLVLAS
jgi:transposase